MSKITIYTDGACSGNPGPGGYAALICCSEKTIQVSGNEKDTTNNRMELKAVTEALEEVHKMIFQENEKIDNLEIISDSAYVVNAINKNWLNVWKLNGFKSSKGEDIKNIDLWLNLYDKLQVSDFIKLDIVFTKVKGHSGNYFNETVDKIAKEEIKKVK